MERARSPRCPPPARTSSTASKSWGKHAPHHEEVWAASPSFSAQANGSYLSTLLLPLLSRVPPFRPGATTPPVGRIDNPPCPTGQISFDYHRRKINGEVNATRILVTAEWPRTAAPQPDHCARNCRIAFRGRRPESRPGACACQTRCGPAKRHRRSAGGSKPSAPAQRPAPRQERHEKPRRDR